MRYILLLLVFTLGTGHVYGQEYQEELTSFQEELNKKYSDKNSSPLDSMQRLAFSGHTFFPIDSNYRVEAVFTREVDAQPFQMKTSGPKTPTYEKYGTAEFELAGTAYKLSIYQNHKLRQMPMYRDFLFLPFNDLTNGETTYGGGRYIDLKIPKDDTIIIDFNKSYNPYCAYSDGYNCPIPPAENYLEIAIEAGIKLIANSK